MKNKKQSQQQEKRPQIRKSINTNATRKPSGMGSVTFKSISSDLAFGDRCRRDDDFLVKEMKKLGVQSYASIKAEEEAQRAKAMALKASVRKGKR